MPGTSNIISRFILSLAILPLALSALSSSQMAAQAPPTADRENAAQVPKTSAVKDGLTNSNGDLRTNTDEDLRVAPQGIDGIQLDGMLHRFLMQQAYRMFDARNTTYESIKTAEDNLKRSEKRATALLEAIPDMVFRINGEGIYLDVKADNKELYTTSPSEVIGKSSYELLPQKLARLIETQIKIPEQD